MEKMGMVTTGDVYSVAAMATKRIGFLVVFVAIADAV